MAINRCHHLSYLLVINGLRSWLGAELFPHHLLNQADEIVNGHVCNFE